MAKVFGISTTKRTAETGLIPRVLRVDFSERCEEQSAINNQFPVVSLFNSVLIYRIQNNTETKGQLEEPIQGKGFEARKFHRKMVYTVLWSHIIIYPKMEHGFTPEILPEAGLWHKVNLKTR